MAVLTFIFEIQRFASCLVVLGVSEEAVLCLVNAIVIPTGLVLCAINVQTDGKNLIALSQNVEWDVI